ncbi:hypothetical protein BJ508DRAFT_139605 [Ascobolus immersus RN42]|uniref:Uncharacterized protein n=1 Tax=Ascobolus immersus RN42 TaxID=1160509 RepID=A0A3N4ID80_ASCIM|nr:hypothetical protein BJ508DRAFT_139605 [Ascobolus immersus RN42]
MASGATRRSTYGSVQINLGNLGSNQPKQPNAGTGGGQGSASSSSALLQPIQQATSSSSSQTSLLSPQPPTPPASINPLQTNSTNGPQQTGASNPVQSTSTTATNPQFQSRPSTNTAPPQTPAIPSNPIQSTSATATAHQHQSHPSTNTAPPQTPPIPSNVPLQTSVTGYRLCRFVTRALIGLAVPTIVTGYYLFISFNYLQAGSSNDTDISSMSTGPRRGAAAFYSWFFVATIGINLSKYGLQGAEASMLMDARFWGAKNAMKLMMHGNSSWAGPGGWIKLFREIVYSAGGLLKFVKNLSVYKNAQERNVFPSRLWFILASLSLFVFASLPLSGLTMELGEGYILKKGLYPVVTGRDYWTFNLRTYTSLIRDSRARWLKGTPPNLPAAGIGYTRHGKLDKSKYEFLRKQPSVLPMNDGIPEIFLPAQASVPVEGPSWGLLLQYNCSIVRNSSEFAMLGKYNTEPNSKTTIEEFLDSKKGATNDSNIRIMRTDNNGDSIFIHSYAGKPVTYNPGFEPPYFTQLAISGFEGIDFPIGNSATKCKQFRYSNLTGASYNLDGCTYISYEYEHLLELALFQYSAANPTLRDPQIIADLVNWYSLFPATNNRNESERVDNMRIPLSPIGVQCRSKSQVGLAQINTAGTFTSFQPSDTHVYYPDPNSRGPLGEPGAVTKEQWLMSGAIPLSFGPATVLLESADALEDILHSMQVGVEEFGYIIPKTLWNFTSNEPDLENTQFPVLESGLLRNSLLSLYANYGKLLMYDSERGFDLAGAEARYVEGGEPYNIPFPTSVTRRDILDAYRFYGDDRKGYAFFYQFAFYYHAFRNLNLTASESGKVLVSGVLPWYVPLCLLAPWCFISWILVAGYGFQKRWADTLDAYSMFRFGAEFSDDIKANPDFSNTKIDFQSCSALRKMPGLVGDSDSADPVYGRISLVEKEKGKPLRRNKLFR